MALLRPRGFRIGVVARAEHHHEQLYVDDLAAVTVDDHGAFSRVVNEHLLAGAVCLAHDQVQSLAPAMVVLAELAVLIGLQRRLTGARRLDVFGPQQLQGHAGAPQLLMDPLAVDRRAICRRWVLALTK